MSNNKKPHVLVKENMRRMAELTAADGRCWASYDGLAAVERFISVIDAIY
jgi:hypothetical protein